MSDAAVRSAPADTERVIDELIAAKSGVFGRFHRPVLDACAERPALRRAAADGRVRLVRSILGSVLDGLHWIGIRSLVTAFRAARAEEEAPPGYAAFHDRVGSDEGRRRILDAFPELERLLGLFARRRMDLAEAVLAAADEDGGLLRERFGTAGPVVAVEPGAGDSHRGGATVCFVTWENGTTLVYKPQARTALRILQAVRGAADPSGGFFGPLCPDTLERDDHLWQARVLSSEPADEGRAALYFRRFGRCAALLSMFGTGDLHHENVIATADGPVVIDLETLVGLPNPATAAAGTEGAPQGADIESSVLNTLMFPVRYTAELLDIDYSALGSVRTDHSERLESFAVVDAGTDAIRFDTAPVTAVRGENVARVGGEQLDPRLWEDELVTGFEEGRTRLRTVRETAVEAVRGTDGWSVRQLVRPTFVYYRFLEASTHPAHLAGRAARLDLLDRLPRRHRGLRRSVAEEVCSEEAHAMLGLDTPFFEVECDSTALLCNGGEEVPDAVVRTPREAALDNIEAFFARPERRDPSYIRFGLATSTDDAWTDRPAKAPAAGHAAARPSPLTDPGELVRTIGDLSLGPPERPTWLMPRLQGNHLRLDVLYPSLYEGGGLLLTLARLHDSGGVDAPGGVDPAAALRTALPRELPPVTAPLGLSPFTGALSMRAVALDLGGTGDAAPEVSPEAETATAPDRLTVDDLDYLNGLGGYLVHLAEYDDPGAPRPPGADPEALVRRLVEVDGPPGEHHGELGLAHGRFGRVAALSAGIAAGADPDGRAREHLEALTGAYLRYRWRDDVLDTPDDAAGWCKGYTGIAFALAKALSVLGLTPRRIRNAIGEEAGRAAHGPITGDISMCHGAAGRIAVLVWLADRLDWPEARTWAKELESRFLDRHADGGWRCGAGATTALPSFMAGLSGWHHARLMLQDPAVRLPRCLGGR
ncbi:type 2 lanthipeptide synthetase LanM [Nocardiopsis sp. RSe5-2]|uniref:Type 2 lanthipeptide synthetase LanM n=1 Tax=Nocardiopsis endophytica TaxID=3018445 RepID=A0ABT4U3K7_9ACTN|nr:type 2 lanthipeptide synthetase LanM [Nocardiopsis endophytica]MDA2811548.1 type 2 lanthipeptide synthetase LanM [Nocardiopsis endophytica]